MLQNTSKPQNKWCSIKKSITKPHSFHTHPLLCCSFCLLLRMVDVARGIERWHGWLPTTVGVPAWCDVYCGWFLSSGGGWFVYASGGYCDEWAAWVCVGGSCFDNSCGWCDDWLAWVCAGGGCCDKWAAWVCVGGGYCDDSGGWCDDWLAWVCASGGCCDDFGPWLVCGGGGWYDPIFVGWVVLGGGANWGC